MCIELFRNKKGSSLVILTLILTLMITFCALVIDIGTIVAERQRFQNALDAAALAGALELPDTGKALNTANHYIEINGYGSSDVQILFKQSNSLIQVKGSRTVGYIFARVLGFDEMTIHPSASATMRSIGGPFDYVLFSGSKTQDLIINGGGTAITGSTHTNCNFILNGGKSVITGACEAMKKVTINGNNCNIGQLVPNADFVEMPDFSDTIRLQAQQCGEVYNGGKVYEGKINIDSSIYVKGELNVNAAEFSGTGCILAENSIVFDGSSVYKAPGDSICFYSAKGNIIFNGAKSVINGTIYAPNGTVIFNGANQTVYGRVIANNIIFNGTGLTVTGRESDQKSIPGKGVKLVR